MFPCKYLYFHFDIRDLHLSRYFEDEKDNMEGEVPGGLFTGTYSLEFPEGE